MDYKYDPKQDNYEYMNKLHTAIVAMSNGSIWAYFALTLLAMLVTGCAWVYCSIRDLFESLIKH